MMDDLVKKNRTFTDELDLTEKEVMLQREVEFQKALDQAVYLYNILTQIGKICRTQGFLQGKADIPP